jgi:hypothetical protein
VKHEQYIEKALPAALRFGNEMCGDDWYLEQDALGIFLLVDIDSMEQKMERILQTKNRKLPVYIGEREPSEH